MTQAQQAIFSAPFLGASADWVGDTVLHCAFLCASGWRWQVGNFGNSLIYKGVELPYKEDVGGSSPSAPTIQRLAKQRLREI